MHFGVAYYPEHWPEARWAADAELMRGMGIEAVRMAEFAWQKLEPSLGSFDFAWLDRALAILGKRGIRAILGTPSATPPAWIIQANPEILPVDSNGVTRGFGGRHHDCQSNAAYRGHIRRIVTAMVEHYGHNPQVIGWQVDNELGNSHEDLCHCASCTMAFREWLEKKYGTIDSLNRRWGTDFWSQGYGNFAQVPTPRPTPNGHSPSLLLDWKRFHSDLVIDFFKLQAAIIRPRVVNQFVTHNLMGFAEVVNYFDLAAEIDFATQDQYPAGFWENPSDYSRYRDAASLDLVAGLKGKSFWVMEQQAGQTGWDIVAPDPEPGQLALWAAQGIAHGADAVVFYRWRTCTSGTEEFWHGILPHSGIPGRRYRELASLVERVSPVMDEMSGALPGAEVALLYSYDQAWAFRIQPHHPELKYPNHILTWYRALSEQNIPVAFIGEDADFSSCRLVVAPLLYISTPRLEARLAEYVNGGGHLVLTMRTGVKDEDNVCMSTAPLPGAYGSLLGIEIPEYDCLRRGPEQIVFDGKNYTGSKWLDRIELKGATALGASTRRAGGNDVGAGSVVITEAAFGAGTAWYVGTDPDAALAAAFMKRACAAAGVAPLGTAPRGVELARRRTEKTDYIFALNHTDDSQVVPVPDSWKALVGGPDLGPYGFSVFSVKRPGRS